MTPYSSEKDASRTVLTRIPVIPFGRHFRSYKGVAYKGSFWSFIAMYSEHTALSVETGNLGKRDAWQV